MTNEYSDCYFDSFQEEYNIKKGFIDLFETNIFLRDNCRYIEVYNEKVKENRYNPKYFNDAKFDEEDLDGDYSELHYTKPKTEESTEEKKEGKKKEKIIKIKKVKKVFLIIKERKRGRKMLTTASLLKRKHDKNSGDNIIQKIKRHFVTGTMSFINKKYKEYLSKNKGKYRPLLKKINPIIYRNYSTKDNQNFLNITLSKLFSGNISNRYIKLIRINSINYNKDNINALTKDNNAKEINDILNLTVKEMYQKFIKNEFVEFNLDKKLIEINQKYGKDYKTKFKTKAEKFIDICEGKKKIKGL